MLIRLLPLVLCILAFSTNSIAANKVSPKQVSGAKTINVAQAKALYEKGVLFVDVRTIKGWNEGRIPDSILLDLKKTYSKKSLAKHASVNDPIVLYCNGKKCMRSSKASIKAVKWGYKKVYYFRDGFPAWKKSGYPVE
ncbi:MAG: rhodanese-like domain-containing protein [Gammaproteobacteria bacterium]|nr:rhodanese-like domain-containing protein [Gammaproteobacteria bacterium]